MEDNRNTPQRPNRTENNMRPPQAGGQRPIQPQNPNLYRQQNRNGSVLPRPTAQGQPQRRSSPQNGPSQYQDRGPRPAAPRNATPQRQRPTSLSGGNYTYRPSYSYNNNGLRQRHRRPTPFLIILIVFAIILLIVILTSKSFKNMIDSWGRDTETESETLNDAPNTDEQTTDTETITESETEADTTPPPEDETFLICIDPGHGFGDGGTSSELLGDKTERDINMLVATEIYNILIDSGYNVMLSHDGVTIPDSPIDDGDDLYYIDERVSYVNSKNVDLFVSIHCDSFETNTDVYGTRIYYCSQNKYSDISASLVDKLKTSIDSGLPDAKDVLTYPKELSSAYYVTAYTECPSALIELGFVTNESDAKNMLDEAWRHDIAYAIATAISVHVNETATAAPEQ